MAKIYNNGTTTTTSLDQLLGSNNWKDLLEPLDHQLREFILHCGNFCEATGDAFIFSDISPRRGESRYGMKTFFHDVILQNASFYQVDSFLYAPSGEAITLRNSLKSAKNESNWIGYVAVTTDEFSRAIGRREVYVVWRGTGRDTEWITNIKGALHMVPPTGLINNKNKYYRHFGSTLREDEAKVHGGWLKMYTSSMFVGTSAQNQLRASIERLKKKYEEEDRKDDLKFGVVVTGHSLGGALATLSAFDLVENGVVGNETRVGAFVFGCPQVGNEAFKERVEALSRLKILHVRNKRDLVPKLPDDLPIVGNIVNIFTGSKYVPVQTTELEVDTDLSPYLKSKAAIRKVAKVFNAAAEDSELIKFRKSVENLSPGDLQNLRKILENIPSGDDIKFDDDDDLEHLRALANSLPQDIVDILIQFAKVVIKHYVNLVLTVCGNFHNLEATLHVVAYWNGSGQEFDSQPKVKRPVVLVNKSSGFLKDELKLPVSWWVEKNKGIVYEENSGDWLFDPPLPVDKMSSLALTEPSIP